MIYVCRVRRQRQQKAAICFPAWDRKTPIQYPSATYSTFLYNNISGYPRDLRARQRMWFCFP